MSILSCVVLLHTEENTRQLAQIALRKRFRVIDCGDDVAAAVGEVFLATQRKFGPIKAVLMEPEFTRSREPLWESFVVYEDVPKINSRTRMIALTNGRESEDYLSEIEEYFHYFFPVPCFGDSQEISKLAKEINKKN